LNFYERTGKEKLRDQARLQYEAARERNKTYAVPMFNLCLLSRTYGNSPRVVHRGRSREP
jgi:hypothetical protein